MVSSINNTSHTPQYKIGEKLGQGKFAIVYLGLNKETGEEVALKLVPTIQDQATLKDVAEAMRHLKGEKEVFEMLHRRGNNTRLVTFKGEYSVGDRYGLVVEALIPKAGWRRLDESAGNLSQLETLVVCSELINLYQDLADVSAVGAFEMKTDSVFVTLQGGIPRLKGVDLGVGLESGDIFIQRRRGQLATLIVFVLTQGKKCNLPGYELKKEDVADVERDLPTYAQGILELVLKGDMAGAGRMLLEATERAKKQEAGTILGNVGYLIQSGNAKEAYQQIEKLQHLGYPYNSSENLKEKVDKLALEVAFQALKEGRTSDAYKELANTGYISIEFQNGLERVKKGDVSPLALTSLKQKIRECQDNISNPGFNGIPWLFVWCELTAFDKVQLQSLKEQGLVQTYSTFLDAIRGNDLPVALAVVCTLLKMPVANVDIFVLLLENSCTSISHREAFIRILSELTSQLSEKVKQMSFAPLVTKVEKYVYNARISFEEDRFGRAQEYFNLAKEALEAERWLRDKDVTTEPGVQLEGAAGFVEPVVNSLEKAEEFQKRGGERPDLIKHIAAAFLNAYEPPSALRKRNNLVLCQLGDVLAGSKADFSATLQVGSDLIQEHSRLAVQINSALAWRLHTDIADLRERIDTIQPSPVSKSEVAKGVSQEQQISPLDKLGNNTDWALMNSGEEPPFFREDNKHNSPATQSVDNTTDNPVMKSELASGGKPGRPTWKMLGVIIFLILGYIGHLIFDSIVGWRIY